jgi:acetyl-CoA carboxylase carboxyltransferase component
VTRSVDDFRARRDRVRTDMGGSERVAALREAGRWTVRERIAALLDNDTFVELGTFSRSSRVADHATTPGDGKIGGHGRIGGRPVTIGGDDVTVKRGSSSLIGSRKLDRLYEQALAAGNPLVYLGEAGGARIPDTMGAEGFTSLPPMPVLARRRRRIPVATAILGDSFGGSSFYAALSDFVVQVDGCCLAVTSPRVVEIATGEQVTDEALGGTAVHRRRTGIIDRAVDSEAAALAAVGRFLSFLPPNAWTPPPRSAPPPDRGPDSGLAALVPEDRRRAYDMRKVVRRLVDHADFFELKPDFGRSLLTGLGRVDGHPVGIVASQPMHQAGAVDPDACDKCVHLLALCDSFDLPVVYLHDTPGFLVGAKVEHDGLLHKAMLLQQAAAISTVPKISVVLRKAFGLAHQVLNGCSMGADLIVAWPGSEFGFMDPAVGANVAYKRRLDAFENVDARAAEHARLVTEIAESTDPYSAAGVLTLDELIDPQDTRSVIATRLDQLQTRRHRAPEDRPLAGWPVCW